LVLRKRRRFDPVIDFHVEIHRPDPSGFIGGDIIALK
jgi:hypothetical protein